MTRKERVEAELIRRLFAKPNLQALNPAKQNASGQPVYPFIAVVASEGEPYVVGGPVYRIPVDIEINFNAKQQGQDGSNLDRIVSAIQCVMDQAYSDGLFGVIPRGNGKTEFEGNVIRKRTLTYEILSV